MTKLKIAIAIFAAAAVLAPAALTHAGYVNTDSASCYKDATGAGWCTGSMRGFRNDPHWHALAQFYLSPTGTVQFSANYGGLWYSCLFPTNANSTAFANFGALGNSWFYVYWNASGTCTNGYVYQGSEYGSEY